MSASEGETDLIIESFSPLSESFFFSLFPFFDYVPSKAIC